MKYLISILILTVLLAGCRSTKKLTETKAENQTKTETVQKADVKEQTKVNNDKSTYKKTTIVETEYEPQFAIVKDDTGSNTDTVPKQAVKSTKTTVIEEGTKDNSKIETKKSDNSEETTKTKEKSTAEVKVKETKSVPIPWGWIFACSSLAIGVFIYFSKSKIAVIIKAFIKKLFV